MKKSGVAFSNAVSTNIDSFHYTNVVYLKEAIDERVISNIKNPFGGGYCDATQSRVDLEGGNTYTTLKCGEYLIEKSSFNDMKAVDVYKVSEWSLSKPEGDEIEERELYNCEENGEEVFDQYYDELLFVYEYNKQYGTDVYFAKDIKGGSCDVVSKTFYRTHVKEK